MQGCAGAASHARDVIKHGITFHLQEQASKQEGLGRLRSSTHLIHEQLRVTIEQVSLGGVDLLLQDFVDDLEDPGCDRDLHQHVTDTLCKGKQSATARSPSGRRTLRGTSDQTLCLSARCDPAPGRNAGYYWSGWGRCMTTLGQT